MNPNVGRFFTRFPSRPATAQGQFTIHPPLPLPRLGGRATPHQTLCTASTQRTRRTSLGTCRQAPPSYYEGPTPASSRNRVLSRSLHQGSDCRPLRANLQSSLYPSAIFVAVLATTGIVVAYIFQGTQVKEEIPELYETDDMAASNLPGRPGNLTPEQEEKLRKFWTAIFQTTGVKEDGEPPVVETPEPAEKAETENEADAPKKKRFGLFRKDNSKPKTPTTPDSSGKDAGEDDKYGQTAQFHEALANHSPESIRQTIWQMVKHDHPDALVLRFLRARKWNVENALVMLVSTMNWRATEMHLDDDIIKNGEAGAVANESGAAGVDDKAKTVGHDFMAQIRMGKSFLHGTDKEGRPICYVRTRLHKPGEECEESLERYTVFLIETARMVLSPPIDTATVLFDMNGFSMANMDYAPLKFIIKCFEANYPESLGTVLIHKAPWVFQGIWKIVKGWLDPVVASKVHFVNNESDLAVYIEPSQIIKELGGGEAWTYEYTEPTPGENDLMKDTETRDRLLKERQAVADEFEAETLRWIKNPEGEEGKKIKARREELAAQLRTGYWKLDPYVRARSLYDRTGALQAGRVDWYAKPSANGAAAATTTKTETSADDVD